MKRVYVHVDANGTYRGNGGAVMLLGLAHQLGYMGYDVALFDPADHLQAAALAWTCYDIPPLVPFGTVCADDAPIVTTWLYSWLDALQARPELWPRLRYWCSGELLRADPIHDHARAFVREHIGEIAICNPSLAYYYVQKLFMPAWHWTNWVRDLFHPNGSTEPGTIGYQPDTNGDEALDTLRAYYGDRLILCEGTQQQVADTMRRCDVFIAWNKLWPMTFGAGEAFGLSQYEALASGCKVVSRQQPSNTGCPFLHLHTHLEDAIQLVDYCLDEPFEVGRSEAGSWINQRLRFDTQRADHIWRYIERAS